MIKETKIPWWYPDENEMISTMNAMKKTALEARERQNQAYRGGKTLEIYKESH